VRHHGLDVLKVLGTSSERLGNTKGVVRRRIDNHSDKTLANKERSTSRQKIPAQGKTVARLAKSISTLRTHKKQDASFRFSNRVYHQNPLPDSRSGGHDFNFSPHVSPARRLGPARHIGRAGRASSNQNASS